VVGGLRHPFERVISTVPIPQFLRLIDAKTLGDGLLNSPISYQGVVCVLLALKERLSPYYWVPVVDSGTHFSGILETTNLIRSEDLGGLHLVYLVNYVSTQDPLFSVRENELIERSVQELEKLFLNFKTHQVLESRVFKAAFVEPVWTVNYSQRMPGRAFLDNSLYLLTTAQLYPEINSTGNCVKHVKENLGLFTAKIGV